MEVKHRTINGTTALYINAKWIPYHIKLVVIEGRQGRALIRVDSRIGYRRAAKTELRQKVEHTVRYLVNKSDKQEILFEDYVSISDYAP